jgi:peptide subunit release factor 1 (eRF1)
MLDLSFKKFTRELNERRSAGPQSSKEFKKLSPKMRAAILDIYSMINKASDPIISKVDGIIKAASKKHGVTTYVIEDYFDNELIK